jgi:hypothetical protein
MTHRSSCRRSSHPWQRIDLHRGLRFLAVGSIIIVCTVGGCTDELPSDSGPLPPDSGSAVCVPERCNGIDDDCDKAIDEDYPELGTPCDGPDADKCATGSYVCRTDGAGTQCKDPGSGPSEICFNGIDDDCDGTQDEGCTPTYQVVVYGSSMASVAAAAQAIRVLGGPAASQTVVLIDTTGYLGGQSLSVPSQDSRPHHYWVDHLVSSGGSAENCAQYDNGVCRGIYGKLSAFWQAQYPSYDVKRYLGRGWAPSASVVRASLEAMLPYVKVVKYPAQKGALILNGNKTVAVKMGTAAADLFSGEVIIDGSETGELLGQLGNGDAVAFHADPAACTQALTWAIPIKRYGSSASAVPGALVATKPSYYATYQSALAQAVVHDNQPNAITWPFNSDLTCVNSVWGLSGYTMTFGDVKRYRWVASQILSCAPSRGALNIPFNDARDDVPTNDAIDAKSAKQRSYALLYFIQQVLGAANWSIDNDQGFDALAITQNDPQIPDAIEKHFPPMPYVRESRIHLRGSGTTLTHTVMGPAAKQPTETTNILNGHYRADFHQGCGVKPKPEWGWYKVPFANAIPQKTQGFLVAIPRMWDVDPNVASSIRMHPYEVAGGQAVGAIAGDAAKRNVLPANASISTVRTILQNDGLNLSLD